MDAEQPMRSIDFETSFRRSFGRNPRTSSQTTKVTREEHARLEAAAKRNNQSLGEWSREVLLRAADGMEPDALFTEVIAIRQLLNATMRKVACGKTMSDDDFASELQSIRTTKHKAAQEMMQQYAAKEQTR